MKNPIIDIEYTPYDYCYIRIRIKKDNEFARYIFAIFEAYKVYSNNDKTEFKIKVPKYKTIEERFK